MLEVLGRRELADEIARARRRLEGHAPAAVARRPQSRRRRDRGRLRQGRGAAAPDRAGGRARRRSTRGCASLVRAARLHARRRPTTSSPTCAPTCCGDDAALEARMQPAGVARRAGLPPNATQPTAAAFDEVDAAVKRFAAGTPAAQLDTKGWVTQQWLHFLGSLPERAHAGADRRPRSGLRLLEVGQQRDPVRLAADRHPASLRAGDAGARALPDLAGPPQVPAAAVR